MEGVNRHENHVEQLNALFADESAREGAREAAEALDAVGTSWEDERW